MNGELPPDPLEPETLKRLLDTDGAGRQKFRARYEQLDEPMRRIADRRFANLVVHRNEASDATLDRVEARHNLKHLYGE